MILELIPSIEKIKSTFILTIVDSLKFVNLFGILCNSKRVDGLQK